MSDLIGIVGNSGSGKSTSIRTLNPENTFIINVAGKSLPFRGAKKNYKPLIKDSKGKFVGNLYHTSDVTQISKILIVVDKTRPEITVVIIEDAQYIMAFEAMERASEKGC